MANVVEVLDLIKQMDVSFVHIKRSNYSVADLLAKEGVSRPILQVSHFLYS